ncbi:MAG: GTP-binding signal recognition particle [Bacteroidetes bacterium]|nr:GTP-binding signal recognition particle [Bacteroidota bacterium]
MADSELHDQLYVSEPDAGYWDKNDFLFQDETRLIIGICMEVHRTLGRGFSEIVYKDALEWELTERKIPFQREKKFVVNYKTIILPHSFVADFVVFDSVIIEIKAKNGIVDEHLDQTLNYLAVSKCPVGLLVNFGESSLRFKRFALTKK